MTNTSIEQIIKNNRLYCFSTEYNESDDIERKKKLSAVINKLSDKKTPQSNLEKFNQMLTKIEVSHTKKPFHRLNEFQKEKLVKSFVDEKFGVNDNHVKTIMKMIINKEIVSANVEYDIDNFKILSIKNIDKVDDNIVLKPKKTIKSKKVKV
jgi:hypothetical protein